MRYDVVLEDSHAMHLCLLHLLRKLYESRPPPVRVHLVKQGKKACMRGNLQPASMTGTPFERNCQIETQDARRTYCFLYWAVEKLSRFVPVDTTTQECRQV